LSLREKPFHEKLDLLMTAFGVSNSKLARQLSVDPSLISRWRTGKRRPPQGSQYLEAVAAYFARHFQAGYQKAALREIIGLPDEQKTSLAQMEAFLLAWLSGQAAPPGERFAETFLERLEACSPMKRPSVPVTPAREDPAGTLHTVEVFYGVEGKRQGVIRFLSAVAAREKPGTLLLYSEESMDWMTGDRSFLARFVPLFFDVIQKGNRVKIVHVVQRDLAELLAAIDFWLPLYLTGAIEPYYCPPYHDHFFRRTVFIAPGTAALTANSLAGAEDQAPNLLFQDDNMVNHLAKEFYRFLDICRPLVRVFTDHYPSGLAETLTAFEEQPGNCIRLSSTLSSITMGEGLVSRLQQRMGIEEGKRQELLSLHWKRTRAFAANLNGHRHVEIVTLPALEEIVGGVVPAEKIDPLGGPDWFYTVEEYESHLVNIIHLLKTCPNFHLYLSHRSPFLNVRIAVKEEAGVMVIKTTPPPAVFAFSQGNMVQAFYCYLEEVIRGLPPRQRDRQQVIETLSAIVQGLQRLRSSAAS